MCVCNYWFKLGIREKPLPYITQAENVLVVNTVMSWHSSRYIPCSLKANVSSIYMLTEIHEPPSKSHKSRMM
jgi:hypothetical protein